MFKTDIAMLEAQAIDWLMCQSTAKSFSSGFLSGCHRKAARKYAFQVNDMGVHTQFWRDCSQTENPKSQLLSQKSFRFMPKCFQPGDPCRGGASSQRRGYCIMHFQLGDDAGARLNQTTPKAFSCQDLGARQIVMVCFPMLTKSGRFDK